MSGSLCLLSTCTGNLEPEKNKEVETLGIGDNQEIVEFRYKGFYKGLKIKRIGVIWSESSEIKPEPGGEYLLWIREKAVLGGTVYGFMIRCQSLE